MEKLKLLIFYQLILPIAGLVKELAAVSHTTGHAQALSQGSSGYINKVEPGGGVTLEVRVNLSEVHEVSCREESSLGPGSVQDWSSVPLGQDKPEQNDFINNFRLNCS